MDAVDLVSEDFQTLTLRGLDNLLEFIHFPTERPEDFIEGLDLARDLLVRPGMMIFPACSDLNRERVARLVKLQQANPEFELEFTLRVNPPLVDRCRAEVSALFANLLARRSESSDCRLLFKDFGGRLDEVLALVLADDKIALTLYQTIFRCSNSKYTGAARFLEFTFDCALFSLAIASAAEFQSVVGEKLPRLAEVAVAALFHNYGALLRVEELLRQPEKERQAFYQSVIGEGLAALGRLEVGNRVTEVIQYVCAYNRLEKDFLGRKDWPSIAAGIVLTVVHFLQSESGVFSYPQSFKLATDLLNARAFGGWLDETSVHALSRLLGLVDIFDFYKQMVTLTGECPYYSAVPYPLTGFKSPTIFVCRHTRRECEYLEGSHGAVNLVKPLGDLPVGKYHRCNLLTPKLMNYYERHYEEIKLKKT